MPVFKSSLDMAGTACEENRAHMLSLVALPLMQIIVLIGLVLMVRSFA